MAKKKNDTGKNKTNPQSSEPSALEQILKIKSETMLKLIFNGFLLGVTPKIYKSVYENLESIPELDRISDCPWEIDNFCGDDGEVDLDLLNRKFNGLAERCLNLIANNGEPERLEFPTLFDQESGAAESPAGDEDYMDSEDPFGDLLSQMVRNMRSNRINTMDNFQLAPPMKDANKKTLKFKIKIKGIAKPPVWREVEVPANYDFGDFADIIMQVFGWEGSHLWMFQKKAYDSTLTISPENGFDDMALFEEHKADPENVKLTQVFRDKGDKFEFIYDFGDDWIHEISLVEVIGKKSDYPVVTKFKGNMMIEDIGGIWGYTGLRDFYENHSKMTKKERKDFIEGLGFEDEDEALYLFEYTRFNIDDLNRELKDDYQS